MESPETILTTPWIIAAISLVFALIAYYRSKIALANTFILRDAIEDLLVKLGDTVELDVGDDVVDISRDDFDLMNATVAELRARNEELKKEIAERSANDE